MNENMIADLTTRGYTIQPLLGAAEVHKLTQLHAETTPAVPSDYYVTAFGQDIAVRRRIFDEIKSIAEDAVARLVPGYRIVMASFVTKRAHSTAGRLPRCRRWAARFSPRAIPAWSGRCRTNGRSRSTFASERRGRRSRWGWA